MKFDIFDIRFGHGTKGIEIGANAGLFCRVLAGRQLERTSPWQTQCVTFPSLDVGKQSQLIGGFKVGDLVPSDVTSPPVASSYKPGFGFAITFTKP